MEDDMIKYFYGITDASTESLSKITLCMLGFWSVISFAVMVTA